MNIKNIKITVLLCIGIISITTSCLIVEDITKSILVQFQDAVDNVPFFVPALYFLNFVQIAVSTFGLLALLFYLLLTQLNKEKK